MQRIFTRFFIGTLLPLVFGSASFAQEPFTATLNVNVDKPGIKVSPSLYGIFFEEINLAGDGGIYPELIRNRSFEFKDEPEFWSVTTHNNAKGNITREKHDAGSEFNQNVLQVNVVEPNGLTIVNEGYWGVPVAEGELYNLVVTAKAGNDFNGSLDFQILSADRVAKSASVKLDSLGKEWKTYTFTIKSSTYDPKAVLGIVPSAKGTFYLDYVSLKPAKTYKNHGLRTDLMEKLAALKPAFVRFPGGCWVEGNTMKEASRWKKTIGSPINRWTQPNLWGYMSTNGLGYHEYLQMCEDIGADAMFVINCGMSHKENIPMDKMDEYVQDALDAIEYANGSETSKWGKVRAENGHPKPFSLKYLEVGNENGGRAYWERYDLFYTKIREKYPDIQLVACLWGGTPTNTKPIEIHDEHYYSTPEFFVKNANRYDSYSREGKKIYVGEYAVTKNAGKGNLDAAIGEAAFMTGMEKNSDVVTLSSYAPLFVNVNHRRWNPDLICFDGTRSYGIPSYYVQQLFSVHRADVIVPNVVSTEKNEEKISGSVGVGSWLTSVEYKDAKVVKDGKTIYESPLDKAPEKAVKGKGDWKFENGVLRQSSNEANCRYTFGDENWSDYTFSVKARKVAGSEGFLIIFNRKDDERFGWLNIGGWGNTGTGIEQQDGGGAIGDKANFIVETNRWYDIRVELKGVHVKCFIDDKLIIERDLTPRTTNGLYVVSGLNEQKNEIIVKVVNTSTEPYETKISLAGIEKINTTVKKIVLTSSSKLDENTLDNPENVSPKESEFRIDSPNFKQTFSGKSLNVLRIPFNR